MELTPEQKHWLRLTAKGEADGNDGWAKVSNLVMNLHERIRVPDDLIEFETYHDGSGRCRLTERGRAVLDHI